MTNDALTEKTSVKVRHQETVFDAFCALAGGSNASSMTAGLVRLAALATGADVGSLTVSSKHGMRVLAPYNFQPPAKCVAWDYVEGRFEPEEFFSSTDIEPGSYIERRGREISGQRLTGFARVPVLATEHFLVALIVGLTRPRDQVSVGWPPSQARRLLSETARASGWLLQGLAILARARAGPIRSTAQLAKTLQELALPAALVNEEQRCIAYNEKFRALLDADPDDTLFETLGICPVGLQAVTGDGGAQPPAVTVVRETRTPKHLSMSWSVVPVIDSPQQPILLVLRDSDAAVTLRNAVENESPQARPPEAAEPTFRFLRDTLVLRTALRGRKTVGYLTVRAWRAPIKPYQIDALRAIKAHPTADAVNEIATELRAAVERVIGFASFEAIVGMPGGHSGPGISFSERLADAIARQVGLPLLPALRIRGKPGTSHPKENLRRPPLELLRSASGPVLVVDDVATSGQHIEEAILLLRPSAGSVFAVAWIGGDTGS